jgi:hypothetical protein
MSRPRPLGDIRTHLNLLRTMAAETGADTAAAFERGEIGSEDWIGAVHRCRDCRWVDGCRAFLAEPEARPRDVPDACANAPMLKRIRPS